MVGLFLLVGVSAGLGLAYDGRALPGVRIGGESVSGLDRAAATSHLAAVLPSVADGSATLVIDGAPIEIAYSQLGRGYDLPAMVADAMSVGHTGNPFTDGMTRLRSLVHPTEIAAVARGSDPAAIDAAVGTFVREFTHRPVSARVTFDPADGYVASPATDGASLDPAEVRAALTQAVSRTDAAQTFTLSTQQAAPIVSSTDAQAAAIAARWMTSAPLTVSGGGQAVTLDVDTIRALVGFGLSGGRYRPVVDEASLRERLASVADGVAQAPQDATFVWGAAGVVEVTPAVDGRQLDLDATVASVTSALTTRARGSVIGSAALAFSVTPPAFTTAAAQDAASKMERLSSWTTYYVPGEGNYWGANISIPAHDIDQMVIAPGDWFSFWDDIGPVTFERGYGYGGAIIGGRSVRNGAIAGGICSTSTTLFNAAMRAGLEIGDRTNHSYYIERYPVGLDATVLQTDTWETNMTFRNDTADPVVIRSFTGTGWLRFEIWGVPTGRTVTPVGADHHEPAHRARDDRPQSQSEAGHQRASRVPAQRFRRLGDTDGARRRWQRDLAEHVVQPLQQRQRHHRGRAKAQAPTPAPSASPSPSA